MMTIANTAVWHIGKLKINFMFLSQGDFLKLSFYYIYMRKWTGANNLLWQSFHNIYIYQIIILYILSLYTVKCQLYRNKTGKRKIYINLTSGYAVFCHQHSSTHWDTERAYHRQAFQAQLILIYWWNDQRVFYFKFMYLCKNVL